MSTTPQRDGAPTQPATADRNVPDTSSEAVGPTNADSYKAAVVNLGVNEAKEVTGFPKVGTNANVSMTDAQPGGGPTVTTEAGPY